MPSLDRPPPDGPRPDLDDLTGRPLTVPLLIRGSFDNGLFVAFCAVALICGLLGAMTWGESGGIPSAVFFGLAVVGAGPAVLLGLWLRRQREWLEVTLTGFVLSRQGRRRVYSDDQLVSIAQGVAPTAEGNFKRRLVLVIGRDDPERIDCRYTVLNGQADPLAGFVSRLVNSLAERAEREVPNGMVLKGSGWSLDAAGLRRGGEVHPLEEVTFAGFYDRRLCLWRGDDERPFLRLADDARNVLPLGALLRRRLRQRPEGGPPGLPLGRLLLERRSGSFAVGLIVAAAGAAGVAYWLLEALAAARPEDAVQMYWFAFASGCVVLGGLLTAWHGRFGWLRFHERGVAQVGLLSERRLLYGQIATVYWKKDRLLIFEPEPGKGLPTIRFRTMTGKSDAGLATMRDFACRPLAERWADEIPRGPVPWTPRLRFLPGGLEYRPMGLLGLAGEPVTAPYDCVSHRIESEQLLLFVRDEKRPACRARMDGANFFVGLVVLGWIYENNKGLNLPDAGEHAPRAGAAADGRVTPGRAAEGVRREAETDREA